MSKQSYINGRAFEYACFLELYDQISCHARVETLGTEKSATAKNAWEQLPASVQNHMRIALKEAVEEILVLEPRILHTTPSNDRVVLSFAQDLQGEDGDVRDILIRRDAIEWEIGLSLKHNSEAVKHSRLGQKLDFGQRWYGHNCSERYWQAVDPIFATLAEGKKRHECWRDLVDKDACVYRPILEAFIAEVKHAVAQDKTVPSKIVGYLLGRRDFYKVESHNPQSITFIYAYNFHKTLGQPVDAKAKSIIPQIILPKRLIAIDFKPGSNSTVELFFDEGWQFSLRLHNASTYVEPSLKFDVKLVGHPADLFVFALNWRRKN